MTGVAEAVKALKDAIDNGEVAPKSIGFAKSLVRQAEKKGFDKMSHKQVHWIEKLAQKVEPRAEPRAGTGTGGAGIGTETGTETQTQT